MRVTVQEVGYYFSESIFLGVWAKVGFEKLVQNRTQFIVVRNEKRNTFINGSKLIAGRTGTEKSSRYCYKISFYTKKEILEIHHG